MKICALDPRIDLPETHLHTNYKIKSSGEHLVLSNNNGEILDSLLPDQYQRTNQKEELSRVGIGNFLMFLHQEVQILQ